MKRCIMVLLGFALIGIGAGMRIYAQVDMAQTERRLLQARPTSPELIAIPEKNPFQPTSANPTHISLPKYGLWNDLEAVDQELALQGDLLTASWEVADAGWHRPSGKPGFDGNVVIAGHSPSRDAQTWKHSIFRQLAYLTIGDEVALTAGTHTYLYQVSNVFAIPASEADSSDAVAWIERGEVERLTLITCWPPHTAAYRVLVIAQPLRMESK